MANVKHTKRQRCSDVFMLAARQHAERKKKMLPVVRVNPDVCVSGKKTHKNTFAMNKTKLLFALLVSAAPLFAQEQMPDPTPDLRQDQTLFNNARIRGGFGGPMFSWSQTNNKTGYGAGGGGGVVIDQFFVGLFGMGETFDAVQIGQQQLVLGYGGLWMGYSFPSHKLVHLYTSLKIAGGGVGVTDFEDDWDYDEDWSDATFVAIPEVGVELNVARWMRVSGSVGYRFVDGFDGWGAYGKNDLNALTYGLTFRFGWFGGGR